MTYAIERDAISRTPQDLLVVGSVECQNHYAALVEQLLTRTEELDHADWTVSGIAFTADLVDGPDGTKTADTCVFGATGNLFRQTVSGEAVTSKAFTGSIWMRIDSSTQTVTIRVRNVGDTESTSKQVTLTSTWTRFFVHNLFTGTPVDDVVFEVERTAGDDVTTLRAWGANLSVNPSAKDFEVTWPYRKRVAEAVSTVSVNASRCKASDAGDGSRCYYSRPTCQDPDNFNQGNTYELTSALRGVREFRFCKKDAPLPLPGENVSPLLEKLDIAGQEIDPKRGVTVNERISFTMLDDAGPAAWNPIQSRRGALVNTASGSGTFWRRWLAIYRNYANPRAYAIHKVGFVESGGTEAASFEQRGKYLIRNVTIRPDDLVKLECSDRLKIANRTIPSKISDDNVTIGIIDSVQTTITISDASELSHLPSNADDSDTTIREWYVVLEIGYDGATPEKVLVRTVDLSTNQLTVWRGRYGTTQVAHPAGSKLREVAEFGTERISASGVPLGKNPLDIIRELYKYAGIDADDIDDSTFDSERDTWLASSVDRTTAVESGVLFRRSLLKIKKVEDLIKEIRDLVMCMVWIDENQMLTCKMFAPPLPTDTVPILSDDDNIIAGSIEIDDADESRLTRGVLAWDLNADEDGDIPEDYDLIEVFIALDEEEAPYYGETRTRIIMSEWLRETDRDNPEHLIARIVSRFRFGERIFRLSLEIKDDGTKVGDTFQLSSDKLQKPDGSTEDRFAIVTKKKRGRAPGTIDISAVEMPFARIFFWAPGGLPDYDSATDTDKRYGYWSDEQGLVGSPKEPAYDWW